MHCSKKLGKLRLVIKKKSWASTVMQYFELILKVAEFNKISNLDIDKKVEEWETVRLKKDVFLF